jgi:SAM-dependent methyltransferase
MVCERCGFVTNVAFDERRMRYADRYENSLYFSPLYRDYAQDLACQLRHQYNLAGGRIIEIGCGKGEFLSMLCEVGDNHGVGFDPSLPAGEHRASDRVTIIGREFGPDDADRPADLICCRQVLEHIPDPVAFLATIRRAIGERTDTALFFEVPDFVRALRELSVWDIVYEHCSYFGPFSLEGTFRVAGFDVLSVRQLFGGQFIGIEAKPSASGRGQSTKRTDTRGVREAAVAFAKRWPKRIAAWTTTLSEMASSGRRVALWGAGARGVSFLNILNAGERVECVVDINPRKHGLFTAGTGHAIISPDALPALGTDAVVLTNPIYENEIRSSLKRMGLAPELLIA